MAVAAVASPPAPAGKPGMIGGNAERGLAFLPTLASRSSSGMALVLENFPSQLGSIARIRSSSGGCVANALKNELFKALPKNMWLASWACSDSRREPSCAAPIFCRAPESPSGLRVNCTAEASARNSRWRLTAAWMSRPKKTPTQPRSTSTRPSKGRGFLSLLLPPRECAAACGRSRPGTGCRK